MAYIAIAISSEISPDGVRNTFNVDIKLGVFELFRSAIVYARMEDGLA